jgi:hypothetical protein
MNFQKLPISKQTKELILKAFNKIKEITHGDNGNVMKNYKIVEAVAHIFSVNSNLSAISTGFSPRSI